MPVKLHHVRPVFLIVGLVVLGIAITVMVRQTFTREVPPVETPKHTSDKALFALTSPVVKDGVLPNVYTCFDKAINPPLSIKNAPSNTKEFALVLRDSGSNEGNKTHWVLWDIPPATTLISEGLTPQGSTQGTTDTQKTSYDAPCPSPDKQEGRYVFELYALNESINLDTAATKDSLIAAINGKVIAKVQLPVTVVAPQTQN